MEASSKKSILFIVWSFSYGGGAERILSYLIRALCETGRYEIDLLEVCHFDIAWESLPACVEVRPPIIDETARKITSRGRRFVRRKMMRHCPTLLRGVVRGGKSYDVVVAFNYQLPTFFVRPGETSISWNHGSIECLADDARARRRQRRAYGHMNRIVAIAERTRRSIVDLFPEVAPKCEIVYNGFPVEEIRRRAEEAAPVTLEPDALLAVGRLDGNKRPMAILEGFRCLTQIDERPHLYYLGKGELEEAVRARAEAWGLADRVHFLGYHSNPYPVIQQALCIISLSESEGFQSVFVEGLSLGVPFISTPVGAAEELSGEGRFGRIAVDPGDVPAAFEAIAAMGESEREEMKAFAAELTLERQVAEFERIVSEISE